MHTIQRLSGLVAGFCILVAGLSAAGQKESLKIGMMPAVNSVPLIIADHLGYFADEGLVVELVMFKNQMNRETALQTGAVDGTVSDLMNAINGRQAGFPLAVTTCTDGDFALLAAPGGALRSLEDWRAAGPRSIRTGLLENSIVYFVTEGMLEASGAPTDRIDFVSTLVLAARLEMLLAGQLDAACIPEPLAAMAEARGAVRLADTSVMATTPGVLLFTEAALKAKAEQIRAFHRAYNRAVARLNQGYEDLKQVIVERGEFPPATAEHLRLPVFQAARVPSESEYRTVGDWMVGKTIIGRYPEYSDLVNPAFLP